MKIMAKIFKYFIVFQIIDCILCFRNQYYTKEDILQKREEVRGIFQHAYDGYLTHASGYDELRPLTCDGVNTWGSYSLTLIDALDTLAVMGNFTEFRRVVQYLVDNSNFDSDINVSVFETNIRIVGGLLSAHLMSRRAGVELERGWPCNGPLLRMAEDVARRLLPAFDTKTGMPYGTVNLRYGVPSGETPVTCTAGVGTFLVEFGTLSRLTGDPIYEEVALNAVYSLWKYRSPIGLFGNHIDVQTGRWTAQDSGIGAGVDSYFEYLVKGAVLLNRPDLLEMFHESRRAIDKYMRKEDWYVWVSMTKAQITLPVFQSLEAFWPGILSAIGDIEAATKTFAKYHSVWKQYGFLPEFYNIPNLEAAANRESYPLRPEIIESAMFLYRATKDQYYLEFGDDMLSSIQHSAKTDCGYATIKNVRTHERENRMESFFLAETTKYLYLLFDPDNFIHNEGYQGTVFDTPNGQCILEAGNYIFNTEAHPIDPSALRCCHEIATLDIFSDFNIDDYRGDILDLKARENLIKEREHRDKMLECPEIIPRNANITVDIEFITEVEANFSDTERILSQLATEQNKNKFEKASLPKTGENETSDSDHFWNTLEELMLENDTASQINLKSMADTLKTLKMKHKKLQKEMEEKNSTIHDMFFGIMYDYFFALEKQKVAHNVIEQLEEYHRNLSKDENDINLLDLFLIVEEILEDCKKNRTNFDFEENSHHFKVLNILKRVQSEYERAVSNPPDIQSFINNGTTMESLAESGVPLEKLRALEANFRNKTIAKKSENSTLNHEVFENFLRIIKIRLLLKDYEGSSSGDGADNEIGSGENREKVNGNSNDDIIVLQKDTQQENKNDDESGVGSVEPVAVDEEDFTHLDSASDDLLQHNYKKRIHLNSKDKIDEEINKKINEEINDSDLRLQSPVLKPYGSDAAAESPSVLSDFVQSILKSSVPSVPKFDPQTLLEKIRFNGDYMNYTAKWQLFSCKAPSFLQKLYVHGIF